MQFLRGSRDYCQGVQFHLPENSSDNVVFCFLVLSLFYSFTDGVQWLFQRKLLFLKVSEGDQLFQGGGGRQLFPWRGGGPMGNFYRNPYNLRFSRGGGGPHIPHLDPHMLFHNLFFLFQKETLAVASQKIPLKKTIHLSTKTNVWTYR